MSVCLGSPTSVVRKGTVSCAALLWLTLQSTAAFADIDKSGAYITAVGGVNFLGDQNIEATIDGIDSTGSASFSASYMTGFAVGYRFANNWSVEEEVVFRRSNLSSATLTPLGTFSDGNFESTELSAKVLYHIPLRKNNDIEAYVGAGIAWMSELDFDLESADGEQPFEQDRLGVEFHAGVRYHGWNNLFAGAGVRYLSVRDAALPSPSNEQNIVTTDYDPVSVVLELGWRF